MEKRRTISDLLLYRPLFIHGMKTAELMVAPWKFCGPETGSEPQRETWDMKIYECCDFRWHVDYYCSFCKFSNDGQQRHVEHWNKIYVDEVAYVWLINISPKQNSLLWCTSKGSFTNFLFHESKALMIFLNCEGLRWKCTFKLKKYISYLIRTFNPYVPKKDRKTNFYLQDRLIFKTKM